MNILVVDDHPLVRKGIIDILLLNDKVKETKESDNILEAIKILKQNTIHVIIVDLCLGHENGFNLINEVKKLNQSVKIVILTSSCNYMDIRMAQELDVDAFILKDAYIEDIIYALNVVTRGEKYYSPQLSKYTFNYGLEVKEFNLLTYREKEVLAKLSMGLSNSQISNTLYISEGTTKKHVSNILSKLNLNNRVEAVLFARKLYGENFETPYIVP